MARLNLKISSKLAISAGIGILLVAGMVINEQASNGSIAVSSALVSQNQMNKQDAVAGAAAVQQNHVAVRDILFAQSVEQVDKLLASLRESSADATAHFTAAMQRSNRESTISLYRNINTQVAAYLTVASELAAARKSTLNAFGKIEPIAAGWNKGIDTALASPALARLANHREIEGDLRRSSSAFGLAQAAGWRFAMTGDAAQKDQTMRQAERTVEILKHGRANSDDAETAAAVDAVLGGATSFKAIAEEVAKLEGEKLRIRGERVQPVVDTIEKLVNEAISVATEFAEKRRLELAAEIQRTGWVGLAIGLPVVLVLIGSVLFSMLTIARPLSAMTAAMERLALGNFDVVLPGLGRRDEIGGMAQAVETFKVKAVERAQMEAEQKDAETRETAAQRKADMHRIADTFEAAIAHVVNTVSSASTELEAAASTLTQTADSTQQLSGMVAAASEEASTNVQSVASATDELSASVNEISRQVQESSRIASEAVEQAQKTDARINELSKAANRIGDVVKLITAVAEQTNLLALNATIEAARAGEAGRGFAVVASEVKGLASQTAKATEEIGTQIAGMQAATQDSVLAIKEIGSTIGRISEIAGAIAAAVEEQGAATQEIARNVAEAARGTTEVASNIGEVNRGAAQTGSASSQVLGSAQELSSQGSKLKTEVAKFLSTVRAA